MLLNAVGAGNHFHCCAAPLWQDVSICQCDDALFPENKTKHELGV